MMGWMISFTLSVFPYIRRPIVSMLMVSQRKKVAHGYIAHIETGKAAQKKSRGGAKGRERRWYGVHKGNLSLIGSTL